MSVDAMSECGSVDTGAIRQVKAVVCRFGCINGAYYECALVADILSGDAPPLA
jgi:hypothetical protein